MQRCNVDGASLKYLHQILELGDVKIGTAAGKGPAKTGIVAQCILDLCPAAFIGHVGQKLFDSILFTDKICIVVFFKTHF